MLNLKPVLFCHNRERCYPYLADTPRSIHCGSEGEEGVSLQQHTAYTSLVAGNQYLSICKASLEDEFRIWKIKEYVFLLNIN